MLTHHRNRASIPSLMIVLAIAACGGGSSNSGSDPPDTNPPPPPPPPVTLDTQYVATTATPFASGCENVALGGTNFANAEVEPHIVVDPGNPQRLFGAWQQDRWSSGGAHGVGVAVSNDGGHTWSPSYPPFSRCSGGNAANGGDYERASDPWVAVSPNGNAYVIVIAFSGTILAQGSVSSVLVSRSTDGGTSWEPPTTLVREGNNVFHDKQTITADPNDAHFVYAVWDRVSTENSGPTWFARSIDGGLSWEPAHPIFDPGVNRQTIGNVIAVLPNGTLVDVYSQIDALNTNDISAYVDVMRSTDNGESWLEPIRIAEQLTVGTVDPNGGSRVRDGSLVPSVAVAPGGDLYVAWQDSRFSSGARDGIVISRSGDGGFTWSGPLRVNSAPNVAAFLPTLHVRGDGMIGLTYYDLRSNTSAGSSLLASLWLARSTDAQNWRENQVAGPFDLDLAPRAISGNESGYFLGDYQGLTSSGLVFVPFFSRTTTSAANRTDIFAAPAVSATKTAQAMASEIRAKAPSEVNPAPPMVVTAELRDRISENIASIMKIRVPGASPPKRGPAPPVVMSQEGKRRVSENIQRIMKIHVPKESHPDER